MHIGLAFGLIRDTCADADPEEEKEIQKALTEQYKPLLDWLKKEAQDVVRDGEHDRPLATSFFRSF